MRTATRTRRIEREIEKRRGGIVDLELRRLAAEAIDAEDAETNAAMAAQQHTLLENEEAEVTRK